jgi:hypothetical protein
MSDISTQHPKYTAMLPDWLQMRDTHAGERQVKKQRSKYLPYTSGMIADGGGAASHTPGELAYQAYIVRAVFPELVADAIESMLGVMHFKPPKIELPPKLEAMRDRATLRNESLVALLRRINEEQLTTGRLGLLLEVPDAATGPVVPHVAMYYAEDLINWDDGRRDGSEQDTLQLVVIDESEEERLPDGFIWDYVEKYRVLELGALNVDEPAGTGASYKVRVVREKSETADQAAEVQPIIQGKKLDEIPFVFVNTKDIIASPDRPPLIGLSNLSLTIYRGEADLRQALFMQGQDTLVVIGDSGDGVTTRLGAGAKINLDIGGDAKFIGVSSEGLAEMRSTLENDYSRGNERARALIEAVSSAAESGEALRVRVAARTASLNQVALTGAFALQELLKKAARWVGADPEQVIVEPNLDFVSDTMTGRDLSELMGSKMLGAPISLASVHQICQQRGLTEKTFEEELEEIEREAEEGIFGGASEDEEADPNADPANDEDPNADDANDEDPNADDEDADDEDDDNADA